MLHVCHPSGQDAEAEIWKFKPILATEWDSVSKIRWMLSRICHFHKDIRVHILVPLQVWLLILHGTEETPQTGWKTLGVLIQWVPFAPAKQNGHVLTLVSDLSDNGNKPFPKWGICVCVFTPRKVSAPSSLSPEKPLSVYVNLVSSRAFHDTDCAEKKCTHVTQFRHKWQLWVLFSPTQTHTSIV